MLGLAQFFKKRHPQNAGSFRIDTARVSQDTSPARIRHLHNIDIPAAQNLDGSDISMDEGELWKSVRAARTYAI